MYVVMFDALCERSLFSFLYFMYDYTYIRQLSEAIHAAVGHCDVRVLIMAGTSELCVQ